MLAGMIVIGGFCLILGIGYPVACALAWVFYFHKKYTFREWMRDC